MNRIYGLTIDQSADYSMIAAALQGLPRATLRVVLDVGTPISDYLGPVKALSTASDLMLQPVDSSEISGLRLRQYSARFHEAISTLGPYAKFIEAGNEVNGEWCGRPEDVADKVNNAIQQCRAVGLPAVVTYYYDGDAPEQMSNWAAVYPLRPDYVLGSVYPNSSAQRPSFDDMFLRLEAQFPKTPKGFGEYGTEDAQGINKASMGLRANLVRVVERYNPPAAVQNFIHGGFYWDAYRDVCAAGNSGLRSIFETVWNLQAR